MYFPNYRLWKTSTDNTVKSAVSEHAFTVDMFKCPKYFQSLFKILLKMYFNSFERSCLGECLPDYSVKFQGCFWTHWLLMASILLKIGRICNSQFKYNYPQNEKRFLDFLFHFWNLHQILNFLK